MIDELIAGIESRISELINEVKVNNGVLVYGDRASDINQLSQALEHLYAINEPTQPDESINYTLKDFLLTLHQVSSPTGG